MDGKINTRNTVKAERNVKIIANIMRNSDSNEGG
jgi:hypothetical protein